MPLISVRAEPVDGAVAIGGLDGGDVGGVFNTCEGAVEVGGIGIQIGKGLNNFGGGAVDFGQSRTIDGAVAIGGLDGSDISRRFRNTCEGAVEVGGIGVQVGKA